MGDRGELEVLTVRLSVAELSLINNALNEVANGVEIEEPEFGTRLGASRAEARQLLDRIHGLLARRRHAERPSSAARRA